MGLEHLSFFTKPIFGFKNHLRTVWVRRHRFVPTKGVISLSVLGPVPTEPPPIIQLNEPQNHECNRKEIQNKFNWNLFSPKI
jgi:hypothetical protein